HRGNIRCRAMTKRRGPEDPDRRGDDARPPTGPTEAGADREGAAFVAAMQGVARLKGPGRIAVTPPPAQGARRAAAAERLARGGPGRGALPSADAPPWDAFTVEVVGETWTARANGI